VEDADVVFHEEWNRKHGVSKTIDMDGDDDGSW
jgi:hypothetical protein